MAYKAEQIPASSVPLKYNKNLCIGCGRCVEACQVDVLIQMEKGDTPIVMYPGECWYCGACVMECPIEGAVEFSHPVMNRTKFIARR